MLTLPIKLKQEPLVDVVFELRFDAAAPASKVLPGLLYAKLTGDKEIKSLPASEFPDAVRQADPNFRFAPLVQLSWNNFHISVSDNSLVVSCLMPYPGWDDFKAAIEKVIENIDGANFIKSVSRYSLKYIDLIPEKEVKNDISLINASIELGGRALKTDGFALRVDTVDEGILSIVNILSSAQVERPGGIREQGIIIDVDTIININVEFKDWEGGLSVGLDRLHEKNKRTFFEILQPDTLNSLGPVYDH